MKNYDIGDSLKGKGEVNTANLNEMRHSPLIFLKDDFSYLLWLISAKLDIIQYNSLNLIDCNRFV